MTKKEDRITKDMVIGDIIAKNKEAAVKMMEHGLHCVGCMVASSETLEQGCKAHGMEEKQIDKLVEDINNLK